MTFGVDPDTHIDSLEQAEAATVEGTSKWSCKLTITGTNNNENNKKKPKQKRNLKSTTNLLLNLYFLYLLVPKFPILELFIFKIKLISSFKIVELNQNSVKELVKIS